MDLIVTCLKDRVVPANRKEVIKLMYQATNCTLIDNILYKRGMSLPLFRCLWPEERKRVLEELHAEECSNHIRSQSHYVRALRLGYYSSTLKANVKELVQKCH